PTRTARTWCARMVTSRPCSRTSTPALSPPHCTEPAGNRSGNALASGSGAGSSTATTAAITLVYGECLTGNWVLPSRHREGRTAMKASFGEVLGNVRQRLSRRRAQVTGGVAALARQARLPEAADTLRDKAGAASAQAKTLTDRVQLPA